MGSSIDLSKFLKLTIWALLTCITLTGCGASLPERDEQGRHLSPPAENSSSSEIPDIVDTPLSSADGSVSNNQPIPDLYSVVAQDLPVRELLFTIARDAGINIDIHPDVAGRVSLNAVDQTLPQILDRIANQTQTRWSADVNGNLLIEQDKPYWHTYRVNYVNVQRTSNTSADIATAISGGGNTSSAQITQTSENNFWQTLIDNLSKLAEEEEIFAEEVVFAEEASAIESAPVDSSEGGNSEEDKNVVANPESGVIAVRATSSKHQEIESFINFVESRSLQQVLIEATVVEVTLSDRYQAGVDWAKLSRPKSPLDTNLQNLPNGTPNPDALITDEFTAPIREGFNQILTGGNISSAPTSVFTIDNGSDLSATVRALSQFGDSQVLSSPKIMALNNQSAMLRVVDNRVYFTIDVEAGTVSAEGVVLTPTTFTSEINTVPVGFSMSVTPQIGNNDQVTLNVRPTISRIVRFVNDPNPVLAQEGVVNSIPEIQVREMESVLKVYSGQTAILGGLMQDSLEKSTSGVPTASRIPLLGNLFSYRDDTARKTELIIFIKPIVINQPSLESDLKEYRRFLPSDGAKSLSTSKTTKSDFWGR